MVVDERSRHEESHDIVGRLLQLELEGGTLVESGAPRRQWIDLDGWSIFAGVDDRPTPGRQIAVFRRRDGAQISIRHDDAGGRVFVPFSFDDAMQGYLSELWTSAARQRRMPGHALNFFYTVKGAIPRSFQLAARRAIIRWQQTAVFPQWPLDDSVSRLASLYAHCCLVAAGKSSAPFTWFWPDGLSSALILTHDVESSDGVKRMLDIADLEEELGFRSSFNLGAWYSVDPGIVAELHARGFELGVHGLRHDRSLFASRAAFESSQQALRNLAAGFDAVGFRSPATYRVQEWLPELPFSYDCSVANSDPFEPQPGGCCSVWPFFLGPVVELPYTLPQDHTLFTLLGHRDPSLWIEQARRIEEMNGLIQCVSHPDIGYLGDRAHRASYREFLESMAERSSVWRALPREVAEWWKGRDAGTDVRRTRGVVQIDHDPQSTRFLPPAKAG